jgi:DNA helicase-2/ATP-dependent DNA helicase PcrA
LEGLTVTPTPEQLAIITAARDTKESLLINAYAGAAKTTTLELIAKSLPVGPILCLAFNKRIAEEMKKRLPGHVTCKTLNAVGHGVWATAVGKRLTVDTRKSFEILKGVVNDLSKAHQADARAVFGDTLKAVSHAKMVGYIPPGVAVNSARPLCTTEQFVDSFEEDPDDLVLDLVDEVLKRSVAAAYNGSIDFDDQIYMPTLFGGTFPRFPLVKVDEAQDLAPLNHAMLRKLVVNRLIAVGDPFQSIYAFRGAMTSSMATLRETFNMREMTLSVSFRCPQAVVRRAWFRVPAMRWAEWAIPGEVIELETWDARSIPDGAAIICRNNAPLFRTAMDLIRAGRGVQVIGQDIGPGLIKILKSLGPETLTQEQTNDAINRWEAERLSKTRAKASTADRADCLRVFASFGNTLGAAIAYAEHLFKSQGPVQLLSGHKAKGLEWGTVYHLDPWRIPSTYAESTEEIEQELNVRYVIETRAKERLYLVNREDFRYAS